MCEQTEVYTELHRDVLCFFHANGFELARINNYFDFNDVSQIDGVDFDEMIDCLNYISKAMSFSFSTHCFEAMMHGYAEACEMSKHFK